MSWSIGVLKPDPRIYRAALEIGIACLGGRCSARRPVTRRPVIGILFSDARRASSPMNFRRKTFPRTREVTMGFLLLGVDSLIACIAVGPMKFSQQR
jgi:hypothetical protein